MRRDHLLLAATLTLCVVLLVIAMLLWRGNVSRDTQILELEAHVADLSVTQPSEGGAETDAPPARPQSGDWTFPIAAADYLQQTSPFGYRVSPILGVERYHQGIDVASVWLAQVVAARDGVVVEHWPPPDGYFRGHDVYGGLVILEHENGWRSFYAHLSETRVNTGDTVRAGDVIGRVGDTGQSRGMHLHFEIVDTAGARVNPLLYVSPEPAD